MLVFLVLITLLAFGTWGTLRRWHWVAQTQLALDRCVGRQALILRQTMVNLEASNHRMRELRASLAVSRSAGILIGASAAAAEALTALLWAEVARQEAELLSWRGRQGRWLLERGCADLVTHGFPLPLPSMGWHRPPDDPLGPCPLERPPSAPFRIELLRPPRRAGAEVLPGAKPGSWDAHWD
jgi:hypothetical protein